MKIQTLFDSFIEAGIARDPRGVVAVRAILAQRKKDYAALSSKDKKEYDTDQLTNPYSDSRMLYGSGAETVRALMVGIDIETPELLLAQSLRAAGTRVDAVLMHHPEGKAYANFYGVIGMQAEILRRQGVPISAAEHITFGRAKDISRKLLPQNHQRTVDAARLLKMPLMATHTVADNHVATYLQDRFDALKNPTLADCVDMLMTIPEYQQAREGGAGPRILNGDDKNLAGKIFVDMTGGTENAKAMIAKLATAGVGTIVGMHMGEDNYKEAQKHHVNVIIAGHMSSDNLGMNLLLDAAEKKCGPLTIIECSGFRRVKRKTKK